MSITKLYAGVVGDPLNTSGPVLAASVNQLIDTHVSHLKALPTAANAQTDTVYNVVGFYSGTTKGGGKLVYDATASKTQHNGLTHYAPESLIAWDGTQSNLGTLLNWTGTGSGCWIRVLEDYITPELAGAVPNNGMDCTLPIQKCVTYLGNNGGGKLRIPSGTFDMTSAINISGQSVLIEGDSRFASLLRQKTLNAKILNITGNYCGVKSLSFIYDGTPANGGAAIYVTSAYVTLDDFAVRSCFEGVYFRGGTAMGGKVTNFEILDYEAVGLHAVDLNDLFVDNFIMNAGNSMRGTFGGIRLENKVEAFICSNGDILLGVFSMTMDAVNNTLGNRPAYNNFTNVFFDSAQQSTQVNKCVETSFVGCWFSGGRLSSGTGNAGCSVSSSRSIQFTNTRFFNCGGTGLVVNSSSTDITLENCKAESNSVTLGDGIAHGIQFANNTQQFKIIGCTASNGLYTGKQGYGILIGDGCDNFVVSNNNLLGNLTGSILRGATGQDGMFVNNLGYRSPPINYTPVITGSTTAGVGTYSSQVGKYYLDGDVVHFSISITWTAHTGTGGTLISLPIPAADFGTRVPFSVYSDNLAFGAGKQLGAFVGASGSVLAVRAIDPSGGGTSEFFDTAGTIHISGLYRRA